MERIKQALERARSERASVAARQALPMDGCSGQIGNGPVVYAQTRTMSFSPEYLREKRIIVSSGNDAAQHAYKVLRTQVLQRLGDHGWKSLLITSPEGGAGKTLTAINLAINLAKDVHHTVLLVDLDLCHPSIHEYFGYEPDSGLSDYLLGAASLGKILLDPGMERLFIVPGNEPVTQSAEILSSPKMIQFVEELENRYPSPLVIFDMPPLLANDDVLAFAPYVDAALLVIEVGKTRREDVMRALELLERTNVLGTVLNKSPESGSAYY